MQRLHLLAAPSGQTQAGEADADTAERSGLRSFGLELAEVVLVDDEAARHVHLAERVQLEVESANQLPGPGPDRSPRPGVENHRSPGQADSKRLRSGETQAGG